MYLTQNTDLGYSDTVVNLERSSRDRCCRYRCVVAGFDQVFLS